MKPIIPFLLACLLHSCSPDSAQTEPESPPARPICLSATIDGAATTAATRVVKTGVIEDGGDNAKAELTAIHFLRKDATSTTGLSFSGCTPITATRDASGNITFDASAPQYYNPNGNNTYFVAYWPTATTTETGKLTWTISGNVDILKTEIYNAGSYTTPNTNGLNFQHALAQLKVILNVDENTSLEVVKNVWGQITKIELETPENMTYTYADNKLTNSTTTTDLQLYNPDYSVFTSYTLVETNANVIATGMFPPSTGTITLKVTGSTGAIGEVAVQLKDNNTNKDFEAGKNHTVTLSLGANEKDITVSATTIEPWGDGGTSNSIPEGEYYAVGYYFQKDNNILGIVCQLDKTIDYDSDTDKGKKGLILYPAEPPLATDVEGTQAAMSYSDATAWCTARNAEGNKGWRLPTTDELRNILSVYNAAPEKWNALFSAINGTAIATDANTYWSAGDADVTATRRVRCVRRFDAAR